MGLDMAGGERGCAPVIGSHLTFTGRAGSLPALAGSATETFITGAFVLGYSLVAGPGFEPGISAHEADDLPLVHPAV